MSKLDEFSAAVGDATFRLRIDSENLDRIARAGGAGLFHIPLLALCILVMARHKHASLPTADLAAWTGATLSSFFSGAHGARRKLEWSLEHRRRCADALVFLENVNLVSVQEVPARVVQCTEKGTECVRRLLHEPDEVGTLIRGIDRAHRAVQHRGLELL